MPKSDKELFDSLKNLDTEQRNEQTMHIDLADPLEIVTLINSEDQKVAEEVHKKLPEIAQAVDLISQALSVGGRLLYFGAGTSGRLGVLDAAECPPTFGTDPSVVQGFIAGGKEAMFVAQEGAEDSEEVGAKAVLDAEVTTVDVVCGIAASGRTPYVHGAIKKASKIGAKTLFITTVPEKQLTISADVVIDVPVGPEVIMGSTRMKSGTAQKMVLNMLTTGAMIRQGKIYENVMVDLQLTNKKLVERAKRIITTFSGVDYHRAGDLLNKAGGHVKTALVMALAGVEEARAIELLKQHNGFIRRVLQNS